MTENKISGAALEQVLNDLDREEAELRHENTDVTDVMNWMAGVRKRAHLARNADTLKINAV